MNNNPKVKPIFSTVEKLGLLGSQVWFITIILRRCCDINSILPIFLVMPNIVGRGLQRFCLSNHSDLHLYLMKQIQINA